MNHRANTPLDRRQFLGALGFAGLGLAAAVCAPGQPASAAAPKIKLGFDNFSLRALGWNAGRFLDYAAAQKLDVMFFSDLQVFESHDEPYLRELKTKAADLGVEVYVGTFSICPTSKSVERVPKEYGPPEQHLGLAIRVARALGSPIVRCVLGSREDRAVDGGIERQIAETVKVLKAVRSRALDAGVKIAVENHAGDMQAGELVSLVEAAGRDFVGATLDSGNATWALEDPMTNLDTLGPYAVATGMRDSVLWETADGVSVQWTAMGEGQVDWKKYLQRYAALCPGTPFLLEIISGFAVSFPYLKPEFWRAYPKARAEDFARFLAMAKRGKALDPFRPAAGEGRRQAEQKYQQAELERSLLYCKTTLGLGARA